MKIILAAVTLATLLTSTESTAASLLCPPFSALGKEIEMCEDNFFLGQNAIACLKRYTQDIKAGKAKIRKFLRANNAAMKNKQNVSYDTADINYDDLQKELVRMIENGKSVKASLDTYLAELYFPEDWDNPGILGMSTAEYLKTEPCFAVPKSTILRMGNAVMRTVNDFSKTQATAFGKGKTSQVLSTGIKVAPGTTKVLKQSPTAMAPSVKGATAAGSNISETTRKAPQAPASSSPKKQQ